VKVLGIIPARGGSKGIPNKNLAELGGRPLIAWTFDSARSSSLDRVIVSTDSKEIADVSKLNGIEVPFIRPENISDDSAKTIDVVNHALDEITESFEAVMVLQPTSPFRTSEDIDRSILLLENSSADSVISVVDVGGYHPRKMKYLINGLLIDPPFGELHEHQPRQQLEPVYIRNGVIYLTRVATLRQNSFKGNSCLAYVMDRSRSVNIDEPLDLVLAEAFLRIRS
jgi:CMP-N,N'-diacetyllegionaminic acid synthase